MKLSTWRPSLLGWLQNRVTVDSWSLTRPEGVGETNAFLPPLRDVHYNLDSPTQVTGKATQEFYIVKRLSRKLLYASLPLAHLEGLHASLSIRLVHDYSAIADIRNLEFAQVEHPVSVTETGEEQGSWLIELAWAFEIAWDAEPEDGAVVQPFTLNRLNLNLWRDHLDDDTSNGASDPIKRRLDFTFTAERTE